jgi:hypothetical protein
VVKDIDRINQLDPDEITIKGLVIKLKSGIRYIKSKRLLLLVFIVLGLLIGLLYSIFIKPTYKAVSTFVLEESSKGGGMGLGQYAGIASLAGIDIGGASEKGLFQGDNILELYKSRLMIQKTLLTPVQINGKNQLLIDRYIETNNLLEKWKNHNHIQTVNFSDEPKKFTRAEDSILRDLVKYFNKRVLTVTKPDKKLSIIDVEIKSKDELFAQLFNQTLVQTVNNFYVETQTKKTSQSVKVLQHQADSVREILNTSLGKVAASTDANPNPNPILHSLMVPYQKKQIDVQANTAIYSEIVKNLELSKISLRQETPLIQLIDEPLLPLETDDPGKAIDAVIGLAAGLFFGIFYIIMARFYTFVKNT